MPGELISPARPLVRRPSLFIIPSGQGSARRRASTLTSDGAALVRAGERKPPRTKVVKAYQLNTNTMQFGYDTIADAALLRISEDRVHSQLELENGVIVSLGRRGEIVCIEILDFSKHHDVKALEKNAKDGIPVTISHTRLMDEHYMKRFYPRYCAAQEKLGKRPWEAIWGRWKKTLSRQ